MSNVNILLNYYLENDYLNLTNSISSDDLILLIDKLKSYFITINCITIPKEFKYMNIINEHFNNVQIKEFL